MEARKRRGAGGDWRLKGEGRRVGEEVMKRGWRLKGLCMIMDNLD